MSKTTAAGGAAAGLLALFGLLGPEPMTWPRAAVLIAGCAALTAMAYFAADRHPPPRGGAGGAARPCPPQAKGPPAAPRAVLALAAALLVLLPGCSRPGDAAVLSANAAGVAGEVAHRGLAAAYRAEQRACLGRPEEAACIDDVRARYLPAWEAYDAFRAAWFALADLALLAQAGGEVDPALVAKAVRDLDAARAALLKAVPR